MAFNPNHHDDDQPMAEINVTPLVDVMLVLLIVFMITMPVLTHSIPLKLPIASTQKEMQQKKEPTEPLRLSIDAQGSYALGDKRMSKEELQAALTKAVKDDPDTVLAIAADQSVPYEHVAQALAVANDSGLSKVGFVTEPEHS